MVEHTMYKEGPQVNSHCCMALLSMALLAVKHVHGNINTNWILTIGFKPSIIYASL